MTSQRYTLLATILITICLDVLSIFATAATVMWNPKISRYVDGYNLDKGPVFYEAFYPYPDTRNPYREKRYLDRNTVLETSFQVPSKHFVYSAETGDHPISINESFIVVDNKEISQREQRKAIASRDNSDAITNQLASFPNEHLTIFNDNKNLQVVNIEEISKLIRRAISHDLENWNILEEYLDRTIHQDRPMPQLGIHSREIHKNREGNGHMLPINRRPKLPKDSSEQSSIFETLSSRKLNAHDEKQRLIYFDGIDANGSTITSGMKVSGTQIVDTPQLIDVTSDSLSSENIFQPRPQLIKYMFFKRPMRFDKRNEKAIDKSTPRTSGDNLIHEKISDDNRNRQIEENVKVTSIKISELPRHRTRHHHSEWPKRDYSIHHRL